MSHSKIEESPLTDNAAKILSRFLTEDSKPCRLVGFDAKETLALYTVLIASQRSGLSLAVTIVPPESEGDFTLLSIERGDDLVILNFYKSILEALNDQN